METKYLVDCNQLDRLFVGDDAKDGENKVSCPTLYMVKDIYTGMIVNMYLVINEPS